MGSDDPITISAWLDLAIVASKLPNGTALASNTITTAAARATQFIAGMEKLYWIHLSKCKASKVVTFRIEDGRDTIGKLSMFCTSLRSLLRHDMGTLAGEVPDAG